MRLIPVFVILLVANAVSAAVIDGPANVRGRPDGKKLVSLNDGVHVACQQAENSWHRIEIPVLVARDEIDNGRIKKDVLLKNRADQKIGVTLERVPLELATGYREGISGKIIAYTHTQNIKEINGTKGCDKQDIGARNKAEETYLYPVEVSGKLGYINSKGKVVIKPRFAWAGDFSEGLASVSFQDIRHPYGKAGYIDEKNIDRTVNIV